MVFLTCTYNFLIWPNENYFNDVSKHLCGGHQDFVISHQMTGVVQSMKTTPFESSALLPQNLHARAIDELIHSDGAENSATMSMPVSPNLFGHLEVRSVSEWTQVSPNGCNDQALSGPDVPVYTLNTLQWQTKLFSAETCDHFKSECHQDSQRFLRMLCPVTCGCTSPLTGLYQNGPELGCPRNRCAQLAAYPTAMKSIPCKDLDATNTTGELLNAWRLLLDGVLSVYSKGVAGGPSLNKAVELFKTYGCSAPEQASFPLAYWMAINGQKRLCDGSGSHASVRPFCPSTCGCSNRSFVERHDQMAECPYSCSD